jgi:hypothetical protein
MQMRSYACYFVLAHADKLVVAVINRNAMQHGVIELTDCDFEDNIRRRWLSFPNFGSIGSPVAVIPPKNLVSQSTLEVLVRG